MMTAFVQSHGTVCAGCFLMAAPTRMASTSICSTTMATITMSPSVKGDGWLQPLRIVGEVAYLCLITI